MFQKLSTQQGKPIQKAYYFVESLVGMTTVNAKLLLFSVQILKVKAKIPVF